ncbi:transcription elongation factor GreAB [Amycolatopsis albispora]|uniref:Transcription elongation factor GreAB n=2 Tax=Amycolatopsis albispora TaxID=1804986 RepID=A0A344LLP4_9PSEU|nr:GreA/GreB family elongation factor [Amycolatopsis albispora]AXB48968.1 transcription elongation factor GreAB [Amycolatopsis albispora]
MTRTVWLTPHAHEQLRAELAALRAAGPGDELDDPAGLRHRQRVRELEDLLARAVVGEDPPDDGVAEPGMVLTVRYTDGGADDTETFLLGTRAAGREDLEICSPESPLGSALIGARPGEQRTYQAPNGRTFHVTLLTAVPYGHHRAG